MSAAEAADAAAAAAAAADVDGATSLLILVDPVAETGTIY